MPEVKKGEKIFKFFSRSLSAKQGFLLGLKGDPIRIKGQCPLLVLDLHCCAVFYYVNGQSVCSSDRKRKLKEKRKCPKGPLAKKLHCFQP